VLEKELPTVRPRRIVQLAIKIKLAIRLLRILVRVDCNGVAVLPFRNLSGDPGKEYFAEAFAAELTTGAAHSNAEPT
jgi:hypothetical protein